MKINVYDQQLNEQELQAGKHREIVGGLWDELGQIQLDFMRKQGGLEPGMRLLDLGCGCLRAGVCFVPYLNPGNYFGLDVNASLLDAGYRIELPNAGLAGVLPRANLSLSDEFDASVFGVYFHRIIAVSLWTHLPLNHIQLCLAKVARVLEPDGRFYASAFLVPAAVDLLSSVRHPQGIVSYRHRDPYHYRPEDFEHLIDQAGLPLRLGWVGEWGHPRGQWMLEFRRNP